ncbi:MAG TPA: DUF692 domain-containing protein [Candidatus Polarisedimenticolia bacterium]|nr:DUF692 domain-containing protein [Candidatus Polarisedimenticolia bacterium]
MPSNRVPASPGQGVGLRREHFERVLSGPTRVDWFEVISENFMVRGGRPLDVLSRVRRDYPVVLHGVSLSVGSSDPLDEGYLKRLAELAAFAEPAWVSDHLCWTGVGGRNAHDLLPMPLTEESLDHVVSRVGRVQERLGRRIALENVSSYVAFASSTIPEWEFLAEMARRADCGILLDVNNVFVSSVNHRFDPDAYLAAIPPDRVWQFHLAGHSDHGAYLLDTHDAPVRDEVWELYRRACARFGPVPTLIEWDGNIPDWDRLEAESLAARRIQQAAVSAAATEGTHAPRP